MARQKLILNSKMEKTEQTVLIADIVKPYKADIIMDG